jgi:hypothetical protein
MANEQANLDRLRNFQTNIAGAWQDRGRNSNDHVAKFLFYFAGLNAVYFFRKLQLGIRESNELKDIERLLELLSDEDALAVLDSCPEEVRFFQTITITRMDKRSVNRLEGDAAAGVVRRQALIDGPTAHARLMALAGIVYQVRCNLVHGSKAHDGLDGEIIRECIKPLELILENCLRKVDEGRAAPIGLS